MPAARCENCAARLSAESRFCPECGVRVPVRGGDTAFEELPTAETGPVPVHVATAQPRYFGVAPKLVGRATRQALAPVRAWAGSAAETAAAHSSARMALFRLRREAARLYAARAETMRALGEAVYGGDEQAGEAARASAVELDERLATKEAEMAQIVVAATDRIRRAQLEVGSTEVLQEPGPVPVPEPAPVPSEPPQPVHVPEPTPVPSEPAQPVHVPEPAPDPVPEPTPPPGLE